MQFPIGRTPAGPARHAGCRRVGGGGSVRRSARKPKGRRFPPAPSVLRYKMSAVDGPFPETKQ